MIAVWKESFKINSYHVDFQQKLKPTALMQFFQEAAGNHAQHLTAGYDQLQLRGLFWALSRITVEIERMPEWGESIEIETWPCGLEGLFFRRDFIIWGKDGEILAKGVSGWLLVNTETLRPQRLATLGIELPNNAGKFALEYFPDRINGQTGDSIFRKKILYNEIDMNRHVNNTRYLDWVMDCFGYDHFVKNRLIIFSLEFLAETFWGDDIELHSGNENLKFHIQAINPVNNKIAFKADTIWEKTT
jgi:medium-chain acyl-[acyl-carrier-protein] hydrolase